MNECHITQQYLCRHYRNWITLGSFECCLALHTKFEETVTDWNFKSQMEEINIEIESPTEKNVVSQLGEGNLGSKGKKRFCAKLDFQTSLSWKTILINF